MRVLVTGHKGYIGAVMVPMLLADGYEVVGMDSDLYRRCGFGEQPSEIPAITKDIRDATVDDVRGFDAVFHLAALSNDPLGNLNPDLTFDINFRGSLHLAELAKEAGVPRFVFSSSCSNYGAAGDGLVTEDAKLNPVTPYGESKVMAEQAIAKLADDRFTPVFLRNATAYGLSPRHRFDLVVNNLTAWATTTGKVMLKSDGTPWRPLIHIADIVRAFMAVAKAPRDNVHGQSFNVCPPDANYRIRDVAEIVGGVVPDCEVAFASDAGPDKRNYRVDASKIRKLVPAFAPSWTVEKGAGEMFTGYKATELTLEEFEGPRYKRIDHIKLLLEEKAIDKDLRWIGASNRSLA